MVYIYTHIFTVPFVIVVLYFKIRNYNVSIGFLGKQKHLLSLLLFVVFSSYEREKLLLLPSVLCG